MYLKRKKWIKESIKIYWFALIYRSIDYFIRSGGAKLCLAPLVFTILGKFLDVGISYVSIVVQLSRQKSKLFIMN